MPYAHLSIEDELNIIKDNFVNDISIIIYDVKIRNYVIRYFIHKEEIVATYLKTFIKEQSSLLVSNLKLLFFTFKILISFKNKLLITCSFSL